MVSTAQSYEVNMNEDEKDHYGLCLGATYDNFGIWGISFSQDGREIVAGTSDARMLVYDVETNKNVVNIDAHEDDVNSVAFVDERSNLVVSGSDDCLCKVWDRRTASGSAAGVFVGHTEGITHVTPKGDGRYFISNSKDQSIKLWDLRAMHSESQAAAVSTHAGVKRYHWDYRWMEYPPFGKTELAYQAHPHDTSIMTYRGHAVLETLVRCYFSPLLTTGQRYIYTGSHDGRIYIYDVISGDVVAAPDGGEARLLLVGRKRRRMGLRRKAALPVAEASIAEGERQDVSKCVRQQRVKVAASNPHLPPIVVYDLRCVHTKRRHGTQQHNTHVNR